jgi:hypothetical protein
VSTASETNRALLRGAATLASNAERLHGRNAMSEQQTPTNGYDGQKIEGFLKEIDKLDDELMTLKASYMASCRGPRARIKEVMQQMCESNINLNAFRVLLRSHRDDRKRQASLAALEDDDRGAYDLLLSALGEFGDTELGQAALAAAKRKQEGNELDDLTR